jgi:hypothetical protein
LLGDYQLVNVSVQRTRPAALAPRSDRSASWTRATAYVRHVQLQTGCDHFLVSKLPVIYQPLISSYLALSKNIGKNNTTHNIFLIFKCFKKIISYFLTIRLLTLKDDLVALLESDLGFAINCC